MAVYTFNLVPSFFHFFCLEDENADADLSGSWSEKAERNLLAIEPGAFGVGTLSGDYISVEVHVLHAEPEDDNLDSWDHVIECGIRIPSGKLVIRGAMEWFPTANRIDLEPGRYRARIYYGNLNWWDGDDGQGKDYYSVALWPSQERGTRMIKERIFIPPPNPCVH